jgi:hypothetical protein
VIKETLAINGLISTDAILSAVGGQVSLGQCVINTFGRDNCSVNLVDISQWCVNLKIKLFASVIALGCKVETRVS